MKLLFMHCILADLLLSFITIFSVFALFSSSVFIHTFSCIYTYTFQQNYDIYIYIYIYTCTCCLQWTITYVFCYCVEMKAFIIKHYTPLSRMQPFICYICMKKLLSLIHIFCTELEHKLEALALENKYFTKKNNYTYIYLFVYI